VEALLSKGVSEIRAYDPLATEMAKRYFDPSANHLFDRITYHASPAAAIKGTDALFISTDWEEFRGLSPMIEELVAPPYLIIDGRRMIPDFDRLAEDGYSYLPVGGPLAGPKSRK